MKNNSNEKKKCPRQESNLENIMRVYFIMSTAKIDRPDRYYNNAIFLYSISNCRFNCSLKVSSDGGTERMGSKPSR